jgi:hypothetical protein
MRKTTVLPVRSTPQASAKTFGRPSNTNATTPSRSVTCSTVHPSCSTVRTTPPRPPAALRQARSPATMSSRIRGVSTSRVVERPRSRAASTSAALAAAIGAKLASSSSRSANAV